MILILSAKSSLLHNIRYIGFTPVDKGHVVPNPFTLFTSYPYSKWPYSCAFAHCVHLLCDLGLATSIFTQNFQSQRPEHPEPQSKLSQGRQWHRIHQFLCLSLFFHSPHWHSVLPQLSPAMANKVCGDVCL